MSSTTIFITTKNK